MTDSPKKSNRGGARLGAGRKRKDHKSTTWLSGLEMKACGVPRAPADIEREAQLACDEALNSLWLVLMHSQCDPARIKAASVVLDRAYGRPTRSTGIDMLMPLFGQEFLGSPHGRIMERARGMSPYAIAVLRKIAQNSQSDTARNTASDALLNRGLGMVDPARLDAFRLDEKAIGKKQSAEIAAESAGEGTDWGEDLRPRLDLH